MSKRSVAPAAAKSKPQAPEKTPEPRPTRMEHAESTVVTVDYALSQEDDLDVLQEMAIGLRMVCDQAKQLVGAGPGAEPWTSPAQAARRRES